MKKVNFWEGLIAAALTILAGCFLGIAPSLVIALAITYLLSNILAVDIFHHIKEKKLPQLYEGIGDVFAFAAIILNLACLKTGKLAFGYTAIFCLIVDFVLVFIQKRKEGKSVEEAIKETGKELKK